jgi:hypothetical protein
MTPTAMLRTATVLLVTLMLIPATSTAQESDLERDARLARSGAGLRVGAWQVSDLREAENATTSTWPYIEGYFQRGMDMHLVIESSIGLYRRQEEFAGTDGLVPRPASTTTSYILPLLTSLRFYPFTRPGAPLEPHALAGIGLSLAIEDQEGGTGGLLGQRSPGTAMVTGFGAKGGAGLDLRLSDAFGASALATYQWLRFADPVGGIDTYSGPVFTAGLTYRFRF